MKASRKYIKTVEKIVKSLSEAEGLSPIIVSAYPVYTMYKRGLSVTRAAGLVLNNDAIAIRRTIGA